MTMRVLTLGLLLTTTACSMTPKLTLPTPPVAATYPVEIDGEAVPEWQAMFADARLQTLITLALSENRDLRMAALNAEAARAQIRVQRAQGLPSVNLDTAYTRQRQPVGVARAGGGLNTGDAAGASFGQVTVQAALTNFEIDLFGRLRAQNAAATERYLASREGQRAVRLTVIGAVADTYLAERLAEEQLQLTEATLAEWQASLTLARQLHDAGQSSGLDLAQAEGQVRQAQADVAQRQRERQQATNGLVAAVGAPIPADLPPPISLGAQPIRTALAAYTPSDLLTRRPDIMQAEHELSAANADIGAARAAFFPRLSLTGAFGFASAALQTLFQSGNQSWSYAPAVSVPIFRGGELKATLDLSRIRTSIAVANYEKTIQTAFREVSDGLAARATFSTQRTAQSEAVQQAERRLALARLAYRAGVTSRLELLDAQRTVYAARQTMLSVRHAELTSATALYRALGGAS
ncbi:NodT family efflux transporter outer membrane factor (OMF) lipoprotein [Novosphingobium hassiacum]|uniref:NodT family efflux transporter outer membrane factor (OMF) lipoprotein n=1 Tax=Novosphingobium hassiacum TaxID=173676 RepID=A0A7W5ZU95_9SPHN|nr:efflux transporter outer membrane subunit [Novosphingobium hassiacum]MBB3859557.1 NodT family efflux transporter outer membrane factor (OMF) lipoprotein [Novosphingobium hassiacum]